MICAGIDAGSRAIKIVLIDVDSLEVVTSGVMDQGTEHDALARQLLRKLVKNSNIRLEDISRIIATGYARNNISISDATVTEITCHACGVHHLVPDAMTVIEIGGQDSKVMQLNADGIVQDFAMNDRCAAGTGHFLEMVAVRLGVELEKLGDMAKRSLEPVAISNTCAVFAETEILALLTSGTAPENIVSGIEASVATRITSLAARALSTPIVFTGGVALISSMADALESALGSSVSVAPEPQMTGALGAAILASQKRYRYG